MFLLTFCLGLKNVVKFSSNIKKKNEIKKAVILSFINNCFCSMNDMNYKNKLCRANVVLFKVKGGGKHSHICLVRIIW